MVKLILATDMAKHKDILDELIHYSSNFDFKNKEHLESVIICSPLLIEGSEMALDLTNF